MKNQYGNEAKTYLEQHPVATLDQVIRHLKLNPTLNVRQYVSLLIREFRRKNSISGRTNKSGQMSTALASVAHEAKVLKALGVQREFGLEIQLNGRPVNIGFTATNKLATLTVSEQGVMIRKPNAKKEPDRLVRWETLFKLAELGLS